MLARTLRRSPLLAAVLFPIACATAQIPDGYFIWSSQQGTPGQNGIFYSHPRDPLQPVGVIDNLPPSLAYHPSGARGAASVLYRPRDGALIGGERAPNGTSVDLHVLHLLGDDVVWAQTFSVGTGIAFGEICQAGLLPDGRVVVAASGLAPGGPLSQALTTQYQWEGIGIVDTEGGGVTAIPITNLAQVPGVLNGIAVDPDGVTIWFCNWINNGNGGLWSVPLVGGSATQHATLPGGPSSVSIDNDGTIVMPTLVPFGPNIYRYDPATTVLTPIATASGPLNCLAIETVTGNFVVATRETGTPPRSLLWVTPSGTETLLVSPNMATINGLAVNPNPEAVAPGTPGTVATYDWRLGPNPGGMPFLGSSTFGLTVEASVPVNGIAAWVLGLDRLATPFDVFGAQLHVDLAGAVLVPFLFQDDATLALPIPNTPSLAGARIFVQTLHDEFMATLAASPCVELTVL